QVPGDLLLGELEAVVGARVPRSGAVAVAQPPVGGQRIQLGVPRHHGHGFDGGVGGADGVVGGVVGLDAVGAQRDPKQQGTVTVGIPGAGADGNMGEVARGAGRDGIVADELGGVDDVQGQATGGVDDVVS